MSNKQRREEKRDVPAGTAGRSLGTAWRRRNDGAKARDGSTQAPTSHAHRPHPLLNDTRPGRSDGRPAGGALQGTSSTDSTRLARLLSLPLGLLTLSVVPRILLPRACANDVGERRAAAAENDRLGSRATPRCSSIIGRLVFVVGELGRARGSASGGLCGVVATRSGGRVEERLDVCARRSLMTEASKDQQMHVSRRSRGIRTAAMRASARSPFFSDVSSSLSKSPATRDKRISSSLLIRCRCAKEASLMRWSSPARASRERIRNSPPRRGRARGSSGLTRID